MGLLAVINDVFGLNEPGVFSMNMVPLNTVLESDNITSFSLNSALRPMDIGFEIDYGVPTFSLINETVVGDENRYTTVSAFTLLQGEFDPHTDYDYSNFRISTPLSRSVFIGAKATTLEGYSITDILYKDINLDVNVTLISLTRIAYATFSGLPLIPELILSFLALDELVSDQQSPDPDTSVRPTISSSCTLDLVDPKEDVSIRVLGANEVGISTQSVASENTNILSSRDVELESAKLAAGTLSLLGDVVVMYDDGLVTYV